MSVGVLRRVGAWLMALGAVGALAGLVVVMPDTAARAAPAPVFTVAFDGLAPGAPQSRTGTFLLERDAVLTGFAWVERQGMMVDTVLGVRVCDTAGTCANPEDATGTGFAEGRIDVIVTAELAADAPPASTGSVIGQLMFTADDAGAGSPGGGLAGTGSDVAVWLAIGAAALAFGSLVLALGQRPSTRRPDVRGA
nr:hypothetical protein [Leifsonia sp. Leaf325]